LLADGGRVDVATRVPDGGRVAATTGGIPADSRERDPCQSGSDSRREDGDDCSHGGDLLNGAEGWLLAKCITRSWWVSGDALASKCGAMRVVVNSSPPSFQMVVDSKGNNISGRAEKMRGDRRRHGTRAVGIVTTRRWAKLAPAARNGGYCDVSEQ
jgi:hypothetical protein